LFAVVVAERIVLGLEPGLGVVGECVAARQSGLLGVAVEGAFPPVAEAVDLERL
jgi:hypothetical protein